MGTAGRAGAVAIAIAALLVLAWYAGYAAGPTGPIQRPTSAAETGDATRSSSADSASPVNRTPVADDARRVLVEVVDEAHRPLNATVSTPARDYRVTGRGAVPAFLGEVEVTAPGHGSRTARIAGEDLRVVLPRAYAVTGRIFDVVDGDPVAMRVRVVRFDPHEVVAAAAGDDTGTFRLSGLPAGEYLLRGEAQGYLQLCEGPEANVPGIPLRVTDEDTHLEVPAYPVHGAVVAIRNETNLSDAVLGGLVVCWSEFRDDAKLERLPSHTRFPSWRAVQTAFDDESFAFVDPMLRVVTAPGADRHVDIDILLEPDRYSYSSATLWLEPLREMLDGAEPHIVTVSRRWQTAPVVIETPVPMQLAAGGSPHRGLPIDPGTTELELPVGRYALHPADFIALLDHDEWTQEVEVPTRRKVIVSPPTDCARLVLEKSPRLAEGACVVGGKGGDRVFLEQVGFPRTLYVTPGRYSIRVVVPRTPTTRTAVWHTRIEAAADETVTCVVGG